MTVEFWHPAYKLALLFGSIIWESDTYSFFFCDHNHILLQKVIEDVALVAEDYQVALETTMVGKGQSRPMTIAC